VSVVPLMIARPSGKSVISCGSRQNFKTKSLKAYPAMRLQRGAQLGELDGTVLLMNLHRVAPTERDVRSSETGKVDEVARSTGLAGFAGSPGRNLSAVVVPQVERQQCSAYTAASAYKELERLGCLD